MNQLMAKLDDNDLDNFDESTPTKVSKPQHPENDATPTKAKKDKRGTTPRRDYDEDDPKDKEYWLGGNYNYPPSWARFEKMSKEASDYSKGMPFSHCSDCNFYQGSGVCKIVRGTISPSAWCKYYQPKYEASVFSAVPLRLRLRK
jgi:hypothetical protein